MASTTIDNETELSAVNAILGAIGQSPVTSLNFTNPEVGFIYNLLRDANVDLPEPFKRYIIYKASVRAATQLVGNPQLAQLLAQQEAMARATVMEYECNQGNHTMFGLPEDSTYNAYQPWRSLGR